MCLRFIPDLYTLVHKEPTTMRRIPAPIFERQPVPHGRLGDIATLIKNVETVAYVPLRGLFTGVYLYRFPSVEALNEELQKDASRCPQDMGGGSRGMGPAQKGLKALSVYLPKN